MRKLITSVLLFCCISVVVAQSDTVDYYNPTKAKLTSKERVSASISMGAGVSFLNSSKNAAYTTFVAPKIGYQFTNKFKLNIGLMHYSVAGNSFMLANRNDGLNNNYGNISGNLLFVEGQYQVNKKMIMSGAVIYDANAFTKNNLKAVSLGLDYKLTEHSSIGVRAILSHGSGDYYMYPPANKFNNYPNTYPMQNFMSDFGQWNTNQLNPAFR